MLSGSILASESAATAAKHVFEGISKLDPRVGIVAICAVCIVAVGVVALKTMPTAA